MNRSALLAVAAVVFLACSHDVAPALKIEGSLDDGPSFSAYLVSYQHANLKLHAMVAVPRSAMPARGFPVVIANHGYVPDPRKYGITANGIDSRPGDYYRSVPELYASRGFVVVIPDYRGHNSSDGYDQIEGRNRESVDLYADDVIALIALLGDIENADLDNAFMWSHSMGGQVSTRVLLATDIIKASSFWSTMNVDNLVARFGELDGPVMIQHAAGDKTTPHSNSENLAAALAAIEHSHTHHSYDSDNHYFDTEERQLAAERDVDLFRRIMSR